MLRIETDLSRCRTRKTALFNDVNVGDDELESYTGEKDVQDMDVGFDRPCSTRL